ADSPIEPPVDPAPQPFELRRGLRDEIVAGGRPDARRASRPPGSTVLHDQLEPVTETRAKLLHDAGVEEEPRREGIRQDEPDGRHELARARSASAMRSASEAPSRPWKRSASPGVPHAGQPSTPKAVTARPSARRTVSPSAP